MHTDVSNPELRKKAGRPHGPQAWPVYAGKLASSLITTFHTIAIKAESLGVQTKEISDTALECTQRMRTGQTQILLIAAKLMSHPDKQIVDIGLQLAQIGDVEAAISLLHDIRSATGDQGQTAASISGAAGGSAARLQAALVGEYWGERGNGGK
jgi:hypothetical protein